MDKLMELNTGQEDDDEVDEDFDEIEAMFGNIDDPNDKCSIQNIQINNTGINISTEDMGDDDEYDIGI